MNPAKISKYLAVFLVSLILVSAGILVLLYNLYPKEKIAALLKTYIETTINTHVSIEELDFSLKGIVLKKIQIHNSKDPSSSILASADDAVVRFSLMSLLLDKNFEIYYVNLNKFILNIVYDDTGNSNLQSVLAALRRDRKDVSKSATINTITLKDSRITLVNPHKRSLKPLIGSYTIDCDIGIVSRNRFTVSDCTIKLPENRGTVFPDVNIAIYKNNFKISGNVDLSRCSLLWVYRWGKKLSLPYLDVDGRVKNLTITRHSVEGSLKGVSNLVNKKPLAVNGHCKVTIPGRKVLLSGVRGDIQDSSFFIEDFLFDFRGKIIQFNIKNIKTMIADVRPIIKLLPSKLYGTARGELAFSNSRYNGVLDIDAGYDKDAHLIENLKTRLEIKQSIIADTRINLLILNSPFTARLETRDGNFKKFKLDLHAPSLTYTKSVKRDLPVTTGPVSLPVEITGRASVDSLSYNNINFQNFAFNFQLARNRLNISQISCKFMEGAINGDMELDLSKKQPKVDVAFTFGNVKVQNITKLSSNFQNRFFGVASGRGELGFVLGEKTDLERSLTGTAEFIISRGKVVNTGIQNGLGVWLSELKYKLQDLEFDSINGSFGIRGNTYLINSFIFRGQDIRINIGGYVNKKLAGNIKIDLEFTSNFIQDLPNPVFLQLGKYKKGRWYKIPFQSKGDDISKSKNLKRLF